MATVVLVGTLDTKGNEYAFLRDRLREAGVEVVLVDAGVLGEPLVPADVGREEVARAGGADHAELVRAGDRGAAVDAMGRGAAAILARLHADGLAILVVEQNLAMATAMAERQLVMVAGRISAETTAAELVGDAELQRRYLGVERG